MTVRVLIGHVLDLLADLPDESVHMCVTSPPYFGLREYKIEPQVWGGAPGCEHCWQDATVIDSRHLPEDEPSLKQATNVGSHQRGVRPGGFCRHCGAWRGSLGLEPTPVLYIEHMVAVFREVKRVLRSDGVCFINIGDAYCSGSQETLYKLREDCSWEDLQRVGLVMFGLRFDERETSCQRTLCEMLPSTLQEGQARNGPNLAISRVETELSAPSIGSDSQDLCAESEGKAGSDRCVGRKMCVLRGDDTAVPDFGSHKRRRRGGSSENGPLYSEDLSASQKRGVPKRQIPNSVLQLQLRNRLVGLLSAREFTRDKIPASIRACFKAVSKVKPKDLLGIPWMLAFALRDDGWWLRSEITWAKRAPMPESCTDRPTTATEKVFLLTKSKTYYYDAEAVKEPISLSTVDRWGDDPKRKRPNGFRSDQFVAGENTCGADAAGRNLRNFWLLGPEPFPEAHFATFPTEIPRRAILAGTSERGVCPKCGAGWERVVAKAGTTRVYDRGACASDHRAGTPQRSGSGSGALSVETETIGWQPTCSCDAGTAVPATILDCFLGAGTTALVADRLNRHCIGIELNPQYAAMAENRIRRDAPLFADIAAD